MVVNIQNVKKHFTASVWIVTNSRPKKILLLHHKKLGKWLQPGGHIESHENPVDAAIREVLEETGIDINFLREGIEIVDEEGAFLPNPIFVMEQKIPKHANTAEHYHLDINYLVTVDEQELISNNNETHSIGWFTKGDALKLPIHKDTEVIIKKILD